MTGLDIGSALSYLSVSGGGEILRKRPLLMFRGVHYWDLAEQASASAVCCYSYSRVSSRVERELFSGGRIRLSSAPSSVPGMVNPVRRARSTAWDCVIIFLVAP